MVEKEPGISFAEDPSVATEIRRHKPRVRLNETAAYLTFCCGVNATVVDVSESGLRFQCPSSIPKSIPNHLEFTFSGGGEVIATVAWIDELRRIGALQFRSIPPQVQEQIRIWLDQTWDASRRLATPPESSAGFGASRAKSVTFIEKSDLTKGPKESKKQNKRDVTHAPLFRNTESRLSMFASGMAQETGRATPLRKTPQKHGVVLATLLALLILVLAGVIATYFYPNQTRELKIRAGGAVANLLHFRSLSENFLSGRVAHRNGEGLVQ